MSNCDPIRHTPRSQTGLLPARHRRPSQTCQKPNCSPSGTRDAHNVKPPTPPGTLRAPKQVCYLPGTGGTPRRVKNQTVARPALKAHTDVKTTPPPGTLRAPRQVCYLPGTGGAPRRVKPATPPGTLRAPRQVCFLPGTGGAPRRIKTATPPGTLRAPRQVCYLTGTGGAPRRGGILLAARVQPADARAGARLLNPVGKPKY